jgi:transcriptional antiterminator RfaH
VDSRPDWPRPQALSWFCVRAQPKHEHIAAAHLRTEPEVEVYLPRIRFRRSTRRGPVWFTEALFPGYLFARFDFAEGLRRFHYAPGVRGIVHFGEKWPTIPDAIIEELRATAGDEEVRVVVEQFRPGEVVQIAEGAFQGLTAVVTRVMPAKDRVAVLLDFLGRQTMVELAASVLKADGNIRGRLGPQGGCLAGTSGKGASNAKSRKE